MAKTASSATAAGEKTAASSRAATAESAKQVAAADRLTAAQKVEAGQASATAAATDKLTGAQRAQAGQTRAATGAADAQAASQKQLGASALGASAALGRHNAQIAEHQKRLEKVKATSHELGSVMNSVSLPLLATGGFAIKMGLDFEAAMSRLHTQAGYAEKDVKVLEAAVLKAAPAMRRTPTELAEGLYHVASVGIPARDALKVMEAASIGANIGASNLMDTANGLVIVMKNMGQSAGSAKEDMAVLNEIVGAGNLHMEDLVSSLGKVMPQARVFGLGIRDVGASMDVLTARGMDANMAATRLAMTFNLLGAPKPAAAKALAEIGISATQLGEDLHKPNGVLVAVQDLRTHLDRAFPPGRKLSVEDEQRALQTYKGTLESAGESGKTLTKHLEEFANKLAQTHSAETAQAAILSAAFGGGRQSGAILALVQNVDDLRKTYERLPGGAVALKKLMDGQAVWEKTSQAQLDAVKASFSTTMTSIGKNLAPIVLPVLKDIGDEVATIAHAFESLPKPVQHAIEALVGVVAIAGPVAGVVSKFATVGLLLEKMRRPSASGGTFGSGAPAAGAAGALGTVAAERSIVWGFKGPTMAGSRLNPIAVLSMGGLGGAGGTGGVGGVTGPLTREEAAAKEAAKARGGAGLAGELGMAGEAGGAAAIGSKLGGAGTSVLNLGKTLLGRGLGGLGIGLGGMAVSDLAGAVIGGKTGKAVAGIGTDAAMGAAVGSMIAPGIGTAIGAGFGGVIGAIKLLQGPSHAERTGEQAAGGRGQPRLDSQTRTAVEAIVTHHQATIDKEVARIEAGARQRVPGRGPARGGTPELPPALTYSEQHTIATMRQGGALFQGRESGAAEAKYVLGGVKFPDLESITRTARNKMAELPPIARRGYADMMRAAVEQLEREKRLPQGSIEKLNHAIANSFGSLAKEAGGAGALSMRAMADNMRSGQALGQAKTLVEGLRKTWSGIPAAANVTTREAGGFFERSGARLKDIIATTSGEQKAAAEKAYSELQKNAGVFYGGMVKEAEANLATLSHHTGPLSKAGTESVERNYEQMRKTIEAEVRLGVLSPKQGLEQLGKISPPLALAATNPVSKAYAQMRSRITGAMAGTVSAVGGGLDQVAKKAQKALSDLMGKNAQTNLGATPAPTGPGAAFGPGIAAPAGAPLAGGLAEHAKGGRVPGAGLQDTVPIVGRRGGVRGIVAPGELLIANRHTERDVDKLLAPHGVTLGDMVLHERRPHSAPMGAPRRFATGGYVFPFPKGEQFGWQRIDQGQDLQGPAGGPVLAVGPGSVSVGHDAFSGFGPFYPIETLSTGPWAGRSIYYGHAKDTRTGPVRAGDVIGVTQSAPNQWTAAPAGWLELGFTSALGGGIHGQGAALAPMLHALAAGHMVAGGAGGAVAPTIRAPRWTGPGGELGRIGKAVIAKATAAANRRLAAAGGGAAAALGGGRAFTGAPGQFIATAYGPPWGGIEGGGTTATGVDLSRGQQAYIIAVDPSVIPLHSRVKAWPNPFGYTGAFQAEDTGGAIKGNRIDFYDWKGRADQNAWGRRPVTISKAATGARFAGAFGQGGAVTADQPTMAMFGEKGRETALFVPHGATGAELLQDIGVTPAGPKGERPTEGLNPDNNQIEVHTPAEWRRIHAQHSQYVRAHPKARRGAAPSYEREVDVGGLAAGTITDRVRGAIDIPRDLGKLSSATWKKVMAAIEATLKQTGQGSTLATAITGDLARIPGKRAHEAALKALETTSKTVMTTFKRSPATEERAGSQAVANLERLIGDAQRLHASSLVAALKKNVETVLTSAGSAIMKAVQGDKGKGSLAGVTDPAAINRLAALLNSAGRRGEKAVVTSLRQNIETTISSWSSAVGTQLEHSQTRAKRTYDLGFARANLAQMQRAPGRPLQQRSALDPAFFGASMAASSAAVNEYKAIQAAILAYRAKEEGILKAIAAKLKTYRARLATALRHHHGRIAKALRGEITNLQAQMDAISAALGETGTQLEEVTANIEAAQTSEAELAAERLKQQYEQFKEGVEAVREQFEAINSQSQLQETLAEGRLHREGKDFAGLEEAKGKQEGVLTSQQIAQAQADLAAFTASHQQRIANDEAAKAYEESQLGGLSGTDRTSMERAIEGLAGDINSLQNQIYDQTNATKKLTEATNNATKTFGGSVGFSYQGQEYAVGGQSSVSAPSIMTGV